MHRFWACLLTVLVFSGCASIVSRTSREINIRSAPERARVTVTDSHGAKILESTTPAIVKLKTSDGYFSPAEYRIRLALDGYDEREIRIRGGINGWYFGNLLLGGVIGMVIVDPLTGAMWTLSPTEVNETLTAKSLPPAVPPVAPPAQPK
jgi:hypothetical protein